MMRAVTSLRPSAVHNLVEEHKQCEYKTIQWSQTSKHHVAGGGKVVKVACNVDLFMTIWWCEVFKPKIYGLVNTELLLNGLASYNDLSSQTDKSTSCISCDESMAINTVP